MSSRPPSSTLSPYTTLFRSVLRRHPGEVALGLAQPVLKQPDLPGRVRQPRSEEHTSELQSHHDLVCRLLLEKKKPPRSPLPCRRTIAGAGATRGSRRNRALA